MWSLYLSLKPSATEAQQVEGIGIGVRDIPAQKGQWGGTGALFTGENELISLTVLPLARFLSCRT